MPKISEYLTGSSGAGAGEVTLLQFNAEVAERTAHGNAANPHSGSASTASLAALEEQVLTHAARHATGGGDALTPGAIGAATAQALLDEAAARVAGDEAAEAARALLAPVARAFTAQFPIEGGGTFEEDRVFTLVFAVLSELLTYGTSLTGKVVTDQVLVAATKLLITANTTIYVATTGSDTTGTGASGAPFASIAKALSSIAGKVIASGVTVTIQVADGTYAIASTITIDHPDGDKIQILGNTSAETTLAITAIDTTAKKFTVSGDQTGVAALADGCRFTVLNGTAANVGVYTILSRAFVGGSTEIAVSETIASATIGGAVITIKPCNACILNFSSTTAIQIRTKLLLIEGFYIKGTGSYGISLTQLAFCSIRQKNIISGFNYNIIASLNAVFSLYGPAISGGSYGLYCDTGAKCVCYTNKTIIDNVATRAISADSGANVKLAGLFALGAHVPASPYSPALDTYNANANAFISS